MANGAKLIEAVCRSKLESANRLTASDSSAAPALTGREAEDVCHAAGLVERFTTWVRGMRRAQGIRPLCPEYRVTYVQGRT